MKNRILQAYKQAPWRTQTQWVGLFLLVLVLVASITGIYLVISGQAAEAGRTIQKIDSKINDVENEIAQLTTDLAVAKSVEKMQERAKELGFFSLNPHEAIYMEIPGFNARADLTLAPPKVNIIVESPSLLSSYRTSLWDWMMNNIWSTSITPDRGSTP